MKDIVIAGIAWSGKWTQARALEEKFGDKVQYFEPGAVLRALSSNDNVVGDFAKAYTSAGRLLPDEFIKSVIGLVFASLHKDSRLLVDWFPRMYSQKKMFDEAMAHTGRDFIIFHLLVPQDIATQRLLGRLICPTCWTTYNVHLHGDITTCPEDGAILKKRNDDQSMDAIQERFDAFHEETKPILDEYKNEGKLVEIDGTKSVEEVTAQIMAHL